MARKLLPASLPATASASFLSSRSRASSWAAVLLEPGEVVLRRAQRLLLRQQEVAGIAVLDVDDVAHLAEAADALKKNDLHAVLSSCLGVGGKRLRFMSMGEAGRAAFEIDDGLEQTGQRQRQGGVGTKQQQATVDQPQNQGARPRAMKCMRARPAIT